MITRSEIFDYSQKEFGVKPDYPFKKYPPGKEKVWTIDELAKWGGIGPVFTGSPERLADILQEWVEETRSEVPAVFRQGAAGRGASLRARSLMRTWFISLLGALKQPKPSNLSLQLRN